MIPRYQRLLFLVLLGSSVLMAAYLIYLHNTAATVKNADNTPLEAPVYSSSEEVMLAVANDANGSVSLQPRSLALPQQPAIRARALLDHVLAEYSRANSAHSTGGGIAVDDVYLVTLPLGSKPVEPAQGFGVRLAPEPKQPREADADPLTHATGQLAIVNLRSAWADAHPSGITSETLTIQSILGTLHANLPQITAVRFLADGKPRATLAGNVILDRTFNTSDDAATSTRQ